MSASLAVPVPKDTETVPLHAAIADYLARERTASVRHEFYYGKVTEMPGGTYEHSLLASNFSGALIYLLVYLMQSTEWRVLNSDMKIYIEPGVFYYPDVCVVRSGPQIDFEESLRNPVVVVEVLSRSTQKKDRDEKKREYQRIDSLLHYLLVEQNTPRVEHYERDAATGEWQTTPTVVEGLDAVVPISTLNVSVPLADIYRFAEFADYKG